MQPGVAGLLRVNNGPELATAAHLTGVADLPAHFSVKRRAVKNDRRLVLHADDFEDLGQRFQLVVADELGGCGGLNL